MLPVNPPVAQATGVPSAEFDTPLRHRDPVCQRLYRLGLAYRLARDSYRGDQRQLVSGASANRTNGTVYGPALNATVGEVYRVTGQFYGFGAGASATVHLCFFDSAGTQISCLAAMKVKDADCEVFRSISATAPTGTASVNFQNNNYYT